MANTQTKINVLLEKAGLGHADEVRLLGNGGLNDSYYAKVGNDEYCIRMARYDLATGLAKEADALARLPEGIAPRLVYYTGDQRVAEYPWIIETYLAGESRYKLYKEQLRSLGAKMASTHAVPAPLHDVVDEGEVAAPQDDIFQYMLWKCRYMFTPEEINSGLPDDRVQRIVRKGTEWLTGEAKKMIRPRQLSLLHNDISPSNILVNGDEVFLIDWELRGFGDPMEDFPTGFWDIELNVGKWRTTLSPEEWSALFDGYREAGGTVDENRIRFWTVFNKIVVAIYLTFLTYKQRHDTTPELQAQHRRDLENVIVSLTQLF